MGLQSTLDVFARLETLLTSSSDVDRTESLASAVSVWRGFALWCEAIECDDSTTADEKFGLRAELGGVHFRATELLMVEAERAGLSAAPLSEESRVCQELLRPIRQTFQPLNSVVKWFHHPERIGDTWPECLGGWRYELPPAMQEAIRAGEEVFTRLAVRFANAEGAGVNAPAGPAITPPAPEAPTEPQANGPARTVWVARCDGQFQCSLDCGTVIWRNAEFTFSRKQRLAVQFMIAGVEARRRSFTESELLDAADSQASELRSVFRSNGETHEAWGTMIVKYDNFADRYALNLP